MEITGLSGKDMEQIAEDFEAESGIRLNISGRMSMFDDVFA
ncbi:hypothetical protein [Pseudomaricurvus alkylphenolicus]|nr:hypothetical protein [Pseudomaricurvus alkylphenolicus]